MRNDNSVSLCPKSALCFGQTFFQFLSHHYETLQYLTYRLPDSALHRWSGALTDLQEELQCQVQHGLEEGAKMEQMLEVKKKTQHNSGWCTCLTTRLVVQSLSTVIFLWI